MKTKLKACLLGLLVPVLMQGQEIGLLRLAPERPARQGKATLWGGVEEGGYRPLYAAPFQWSAGAGAETVRHGKNSSWTGSISVEQTMGKNMFNSMFLEPDYFPMDFLEFKRGTKSRQDVRLEAGFLSDIGYEYAAGIKASVRGANSAKKTDLHHSTMGLEFQVEPTFTYVMDDDMGFAAAYVVRFRTENLKMDPPAEENAVFFDSGLGYGHYLGIGDTTFPVQEFSHGISARFASPELAIGLKDIWKRGKAGEQYTFPGSTISAFVEQTFLADNVDHVYRLSYQRERDQLREGLESGIHSLSDRRVRSLGLKYEARFLHGVVKNVAIFLDGNQRFEAASALPAFHDQILRYDGTARLSTTISYGIVDLNLDVQAGKGWWKNRGYAAREDAVAGAPYRITETWNKKMIYQMAARTGMGGTLTCRIPAVQGLYLQLYGYWHHAFHVVNILPGKNREIGRFTVGYKF